MIEDRRQPFADDSTGGIIATAIVTCLFIIMWVCIAILLTNGGH